MLLRGKQEGLQAHLLFVHVETCVVWIECKLLMVKLKLILLLLCVLMIRSLSYGLVVTSSATNIRTLNRTPQ